MGQGDTEHMEKPPWARGTMKSLEKKDSAWDSASKDQSEIPLSSSLVGHVMGPCVLANLVGPNSNTRFPSLSLARAVLAHIDQ